MWDRMAYFSILMGILVMLGGCCYSFALRNPGGEPVSRNEARSARMVAYAAFAAGAVLAIGIPASLIIVQKFSGRSDEEPGRPSPGGLSCTRMQVEHFFDTHEGSEFTRKSAEQPFTTLNLDAASEVVIYTTKPTLIRHLLETFPDIHAGMIGCYGLPTSEDVAQVRALVGDRSLLFLGDCDPVDLLLYRILYSELDIAFAGMRDSVITQLGIPIDETTTITMSSAERDAMPLVDDSHTPLYELLGPLCASLLSEGRKLEVEVLVSSATEDLRQWLSDLGSV